MRCATTIRMAPERGVSLLHMMVAVTILAGVTLAIGALLNTALAASDAARTRRVDRRARQVLDRMLAELATAGGSTVAVAGTEDDESGTISFRKCTGSVGGAKSWSTTSEVFWRSEGTDPENGKDDDGDGLVDEGEIVLRVNSGGADEHETVLVRGVAARLEGETDNGSDDNGNGLIDERGLAFEVDGRVVKVRMTLQRPKANGGVASATVESWVAMRN